MSGKKTSKGTTNDPNLVPITTAMGAKPNRKSKKAATVKFKSDRPKKLSCLDAAAQVLKAAGESMNCNAMINAMSAKKLWTSDAPTPAATLSSAILREIKTKKREARFKKVDRGQFAFSG